MNRPPTHRGRTIHRISALSNAKLIEAMLDGVYTCQQLAEITGLHYTTILKYTKALHDNHAAFIDHYEADSRGRDLVKIYKIGRGRDAKRHKYTAAQKAQRYRDRKQQLALQSTLSFNNLRGSSHDSQQAHPDPALVL